MQMQASVPASVSSADGEETAAGSQLTLFTLSVCSASVQWNEVNTLQTSKRVAMSRSFRAIEETFQGLSSGLRFGWEETILCSDLLMKKCAETPTEASMLTS